MVLSAVAVLAVVSFVLVFNKFRSVQFELSPDAASIAIREGVHFPLGNRFLMFPGIYEAELSAPGYEDRLVRFEVSDVPTQTFEWGLTRKPGQLDIVVTPSVAADVFLDDKPTGRLPGRLENLVAGDYQLEVRAKGYLPFQQRITIAGKGITHTLHITLEKSQNQKPQKEERSARPQNNLEVITRPAGAAVSVDGLYRGLSPVALSIDAERPHQVLVLKPGYEIAKRTVRAVPGQKKAIQVALKAVLGTVVFDIIPGSAEVWIAGKKQILDQNHSLRLPAYPQAITLKVSGHVAQTHTVTPDEKLDKIIKSKLASQASQLMARRKEKEKKLGFGFVQLSPNDSFSFKTRRQTHQVRLTQAFAISKTEVTNGQFKRFRHNHSSGTFQSHSLDGAKQPVVNVSWEDAALFTNWLSHQAQVEPFYVENNGRIVGFNTQSPGYRLPSEAEWLWAVRGKRERKYIWGNRFEPIPLRAGNFADRSAKDLLPVTLSSYDDGYPVSAGVGGFSPNESGLYNLGGNVAEWMHDVFRTGISPSSDANDLERINPLGQKYGMYHVIRGASWSFGSKKKLALAYREYNSAAGNYVGFRLAYYLDGSL